MSEYIIALLKCKNIGNKKLFKYIVENNFEFEKIKKNISKLISNEDYINFNTILNQAKEEIDLNKSYGINIITILDNNFPKKLYSINDPILYLYYKGNISLLNKNGIAIIGSRKANENSLQLSKKAGEIFGKEDISIISGLALGVDVNAHIGVLNVNGSIIAVLPSDLENITPRSNKNIADKILNNNGCLISEYSIGTTINKYCYAKRDRIQSALANVLLVIQADEKSGTMIAVNHALNENKKVYQLVTNKNSIIKYNINLNNKVDINQILQEIKNYENKNINEQISLF